MTGRVAGNPPSFNDANDQWAVFDFEREHVDGDIRICLEDRIDTDSRIKTWPCDDRDRLVDALIAQAKGKLVSTSFS